MPLSVNEVSLDKLIPYINNAKIHSEEQVAQIAASIKEFGFNNPILVDGEHGVIAGHGRLMAARKLGLKKVPVIELAHLTPAQKRAYILADNRIAENAGWDTDLLAIELAELEEFDPLVMGFDADEVANLLAPDEGPDEDYYGEGSRTALILDGSLDDLAPTEEEMAILAGRDVYVEFSGGMDSSGSALWAARFMPEAKLTLCFVDMGMDHFGFFNHLHAFAESLNVELKILRTKINMFDYFLQKGEWPHFAHPYCHGPLLDAMDDYFLTLDPDKTVIMRGGRRQERSSKSKKRDSRWMELDRLKGYPIFQPLYFSDKKTCESIVRSSGVPVWEGYDNGLMRTCCRICPGQKPRVYSTIRKDHPQVWDELLYLQSKLGPGGWHCSYWNNERPTFEMLADKGDEQWAKMNPAEDEIDIPTGPQIENLPED